ncbi:MAG: glucuronate isomerase [Saprospiraceae bacterium]|jgi:glucuronate isomerase
MKKFLDENFILDNDTACRLYFDHAESMPIIDYHNHLPPSEIASNKTFSSITEVWLKGDHYKWRAMRANGISEKYITGDSTDKEKFMKWSETVPYTMRNPLYHWTHLELQRYFDIDVLLNKDNGAAVYDKTTSILQDNSYTTQGLLNKMNVEMVCTTDDPCDSLEHHKSYAANSSGELKMLPGFRPDSYILIDGEGFKNSLQKLEASTNRSITSLQDFVEGLQDRIDHFHEHGGRLADHGLNQISAADFTDAEADKILKKVIGGKQIFSGEATVFKSAMLYYLARMYHAKGWVMQFHLGALRNNNDRLQRILGADVGCDSMGDFEQAASLSKFLNRLDSEEKLCKTILYNLNPRDNEVFATMAGNFNDGSSAGKIQWGSGWWFLDQKDGMEDQINVLSNMGLLSRFIGMLTDSRSFLSFPRHEYFRRILCNLIGADVEKGLLPNDTKWLGEMVEGICYKNAKEYFDF